MREKLIELLRSAYGTRHNAPYFREHELEPLADHLIANGVTFATDNNVGDKWIPVSERLPQSGKCVLLHGKSGGVAEGVYSAYDKKWVQFRWSVKALEVTHWMPLPEPPKGE